jgi:hypothetical protein
MSDKPRLVIVRDMALANLILNSQDDLGVPHCYLQENQVYVEAGELQIFVGIYRSSQSQSEGGK